MKTYTPELIPRQGEITAWALAALAGAGQYFLSLRSSLPFWAWFFFGILAFSALSISFGNWMDRHTLIRLEEKGVAYENGLRKTFLTWDAIREIRTAPARWGYLRSGGWIAKSLCFFHAWRNAIPGPGARTDRVF